MRHLLHCFSRVGARLWPRHALADNIARRAVSATIADNVVLAVHDNRLLGHEFPCGRLAALRDFNSGLLNICAVFFRNSRVHEVVDHGLNELVAAAAEMLL